MEVHRYQFSRTNTSAEERVLGHFCNVQLYLEEQTSTSEQETSLPEELKGPKKGMLYLTQYKMIFQHKDKSSTTLRIPLHLLKDCTLQHPDTPSSSIHGTISSCQGTITFSVLFNSDGAADCFRMIKSLASADILTSAPHLQSFPTASIYSYSVRMAPQTRFFPPVTVNYRDIPPLPPYPGPPEPPPPYTELSRTAAEVQEIRDSCPTCGAPRECQQSPHLPK
ncbi:WW domain-binding protein 2-like isoform X2 [Ambystoma mexicanum]|uniref:WW domain-binding protein 2-like isoform X2 n=1 Tax=Ambystoma mexicanum TaxID=8296 RepID=UPI0037E8D2F0